MNFSLNSVFIFRFVVKRRNWKRNEKIVDKRLFSFFLSIESNCLERKREEVCLIDLWTKWFSKKLGDVSSKCFVFSSSFEFRRWLKDSTCDVRSKQKQRRPIRCEQQRNWKTRRTARLVRQINKFEHRPSICYLLKMIKTFFFRQRRRFSIIFER